MIKYRDSYNSSLLLNQCGHFVIHQHFRTVSLGVDDICQRQPERVYRTVGHFHCTYYRRIHRRFYQPRLCRVDYLCIDTRCPARFYK